MDENNLPEIASAPEPMELTGFGAKPPGWFQFIIWTFPAWWPLVSLLPVILITSQAVLADPGVTPLAHAVATSRLFFIYAPILFFVIMLAISQWFRTKGFFVIGYWLVSGPLLCAFTGLTQGALVGAVEKASTSVAKQLTDLKRVN